MNYNSNWFQSKTDYGRVTDLILLSQLTLATVTWTNFKLLMPDTTQAYWYTLSQLHHYALYLHMLRRNLTLLNFYQYGELIHRGIVCVPIYHASLSNPVNRVSCEPRHMGDSHTFLSATERTIINISKRLLLLILFSLKTIAELRFAYVWGVISPQNCSPTYPQNM